MLDIPLTPYVASLLFAAYVVTLVLLVRLNKGA